MTDTDADRLSSMDPNRRLGPEKVTKITEAMRALMNEFSQPDTLHRYAAFCTLAADASGLDDDAVLAALESVATVRVRHAMRLVPVKPPS